MQILSRVKAFRGLSLPPHSYCQCDYFLCQKPWETKIFVNGHELEPIEAHDILPLGFTGQKNEKPPAEPGIQYQRNSCLISRLRTSKNGHDFR